MTIDVQTFEQQLKDSLIQKADMQQRNYLGMSSIGNCSRKIFKRLQDLGVEDEQTIEYERLAWYSYAGQLHEHSLIELMGQQPPAEQIEVVADYDDRVRGHVDLVLDDTLIDCKSIQWRGFSSVCMGGAKREHIDQVQMYLRHGPPEWSRAFIIYTARDIVYRDFAGVPIKVFEVQPDPVRQDMLDVKAQNILKLIDTGGEPPACECGFCRY